LRVDKDNLFFGSHSFEGGSDSISLYLSLLSAYYQKPISKKVAALGLIEIGDRSKFDVYCYQCLNNEIEKNPKESFFEHKTSLVDGLKLKISAAVKAGVKKLILSTEQKEEYEKNIPQEFKEKLKVYYVKDVEELEKLFWQGEFS